MKKYDLEPRCLAFAREVRMFCKSIPKNYIIDQDIKQLIRSSGSVGANYIEANESLGNKDFLYRIKISRKEAKESIFWLELLDTKSESLNCKRIQLINESTELMKIMSSIYRKCI